MHKDSYSYQVLKAFGVLNLLIFIFVITACHTDKSRNSLMNLQMEKDSINTIIEANKQLVKLWILDGWNNNRNKEVIDQVFSQDWIDGNPTFADQPKGIEGAMYFVEQYRKALPDIQFTISHLIADTNYVTFRFEATATHSGPLMGIAATGKKVNVTGIVIHKVENGKFVMSWNEIDLLGLKMQLEGH